MEIYINYNKIEDVILEDEKTIGQLLDALETEAGKNEATTVGIKFNGRQISAEEIDSIRSEEIKTDTKLELTSVSANEIDEALRNIVYTLDVNSKNLKELSVLIQTSKNKEADKIISSFADCIDYFCHLVTLTSLFPEHFESFKIEDKNIGEFFEEFSSLIKDFADSYENKDFVTTGDLSEYEISPRLDTLSKSIKEFYGE